VATAAPARRQACGQMFGAARQVRWKTAKLIPWATKVMRAWREISSRRLRPEAEKVCFLFNDHATRVLVTRPASQAIDLSASNCTTAVNVAICTTSPVAPTARNFKNPLGKRAVSVAGRPGKSSWKDRGRSAARVRGGHLHRRRLIRGKPARLLNLRGMI